MIPASAAPSGETGRQAVAEARLQGLAPFCLTVDREAPAYLPTISEPCSYAGLPRPELLPAVLVEVLRSLATTGSSAPTFGLPGPT
jgi:nitric oxide reductase NorD protein